GQWGLAEDVGLARACSAVLVRNSPSPGQRVAPVAGHFFAGSTSCVWVTIAASRPSPREIFVCQTIVVRPRWSGVHSALAVSPAGMAAKKLVLLSSVVVPAPSGRLATVAYAPIVSANAMIAPPWRTAGRVHRSSRTLSSAVT